MLERIAVDEVIRPATSGRTGVLLMSCGTDTNSPVELFCKLSAGCEEGVTNLAREVVAACLAKDVGLPVPPPYLADIPPALSEVVADEGIASRIRESSQVGFGSAKVGNQLGVWNSGGRITEAMLPAALSALVFDAVIENPDRRVSNPNCLVSGNRFFLIDHELGFTGNSMVIGRRPPWQIGGLDWLNKPDGHIFYKGLKKRDLDVSVLPRIWFGVSDARLAEYRAAIPPEWCRALPAVDEALTQIANARDNIDGVIAEIERVLK